jgi:ABC-type lipoprotein export system ATPase subunit
MAKINKKPIITDKEYSGQPRGSIWNKWDLHVHTPASVVNSYGLENETLTWEKYIGELEQLPPEIKVLGINDYFCLDGYKRLLVEKEKNNRLKNIELLLPVVELRISSYSGHTDLRKINYHIIFSNELSPNQIEIFFLMKLGIEFTLYNGKQWAGSVAHREGLVEFGKAIKAATPQDKRSNDSDLEVGFANAAFSFDRIQEALKETIFENKVIRAIGLAEWDQMRWDSGSATVKKNLINQSELVFTCSPSPEKYREQIEKLREHQVNCKLFDCSDAHFYSASEQPNRLGKIYTWLKADLSFRGLRRVIQCFERRVHIDDLGAMPPKLETVQNSRGRYIQSIDIRKILGSNLDEIWFDCSIPINNDLVAIIGNQGNGKSALTDIIALCGNTKTKDFSFLTPDKFRDKDKKASSFRAILTWEDGTESTKVLDEEVAPTDFERVRYVPQGFFETVTNETEVGERGAFYKEIKKAIFSHIPESKRLGYHNLDALIDFKVNEAETSLQFLREEMEEINARIAILENECSNSEVERLQEAIKVKKAEITSFKRNRPKKVDEPQESIEANSEIERLRKEEERLVRSIETNNAELSAARKQEAFLLQKKQSIENKKREVDAFIAQLKKDLEAEKVDFKSENLLTITVDTNPLTLLVKSLSTKISKIEEVLSLDKENNLHQQVKNIQEQRKSIESSLKKAAKAFQEYRTKLIKWENDLQELKGTKDLVGSLKWLEGQLLSITTIKPIEFRNLVKKRAEKCKEIFERILDISNIYSDLTEPVHAHIRGNKLLQERFRIKFEIRIVEQDLAESLFEVIKHGIGTFSSVLDSPQILQSLILQSDLTTPEGVSDFANALLDRFCRNYRNDPPTDVDIRTLLKKSKRVEDLYNMVFGLRYLTPEFSLALNDKPLKRLSPGERGILLLVFYLVVDQGLEPLIIDQPEGNLNNQSIFDNLVPIFQDAKDRRQVIIVTHNPNLAVVCDAEQIIHAYIDFEDKHRVHFDCGALENPKFNRLSLDVLEGTSPAFTARRVTYEYL